MKIKSSRSDVEGLSLVSTVHDEVKAGRRVLPHQLSDRRLSEQAIFIWDLDQKESTMEGIQGRVVQRSRHHLAQTLEALDFDLPFPLVALDDLITLTSSQPRILLPDIDS